MGEHLQPDPTIQNCLETVQDCTEVLHMNAIFQVLRDAQPKRLYQSPELNKCRDGRVTKTEQNSSMKKGLTDLSVWWNILDVGTLTGVFCRMGWSDGTSLGGGIRFGAGGGSFLRFLILSFASSCTHNKDIQSACIN